METVVGESSREMGTFISFEMSTEFQAERLLCCIYFREQNNLIFFSFIFYMYSKAVTQSLVPGFAPMRLAVLIRFNLYSYKS